MKIFETQTSRKEFFPACLYVYLKILREIPDYFPAFSTIAVNASG